MNITEEWRAVAGYEGYYEVSNLGHVRSLDREVFNSAKSGGTAYVNPGRVLKPGKEKKTGRLSVGLSVNGVRKTQNIYKLVADAFLSAKPADKPLILHIDSDHANNRADNLMWADKSEMLSKIYDEGQQRRGEDSHLAKLTQFEIDDIRRRYELYKPPHQALADVFGVSRSNISFILAGDQWKRAV